MNLNKNTIKSPLKCWDIFAMHLINHQKDINKNIDINTINTFKDKYNWVFDFNSVISSKQFDAIVITDLNKTIEWVSKGFTKMTGYPANYAKGKKPFFLQGQKTSKQTKTNISSSLTQGQVTKASITNYKKSGRVYQCEIEIFPLKNIDNTVTHFMALEKELSCVN